MNDTIKILEEIKQDYDKRLRGIFTKDEISKKLVVLDKTIKCLENQDKLIKHCDELESNNNDEISKTLFGALIGTCKVKELLLEGVEDNE